MDQAMKTAGAVPVSPAKDLQFCSGFGSSDTRISGGAPYSGITLKEIAQMARDPDDVPKEAGRWLIPSTYREFDGRSHAAQREHGEFGMLALDIDEGNPLLADVDAALVAICGPNVGRLIYGTKSSTKTTRKWRAFIPLRAPIAGVDYRDTALAFYALLSEVSGGVVIPDTALARVGQLVYLPNRGAHYEHLERGTARFDLTPDHPIIQRRDAERVRLEAVREEARQRAEARKKARAERGGNATDDIPGAFNARHEIADLFIKYGYENADGDTGLSEDWRSPHQRSSSFGTRDCGDHWVSLSGSDADEGLGAEASSGVRWGDAFDLYKHFEHGNDERAAIKAAAKEMGLERQPPGLEMLHEVDEAEVDISAFLIPPPPPRQLFFKASALAGKEAPPREWIVKDLIPRDTVTLFSGDGGTGKSLLALQLAVAVASGGQWIGMDVKHGTAVFLSAEDDHDELHRRLSDVTLSEGLDLEALDTLHMCSLAGEDALLAILNGGALVATQLYAEIDAFLATAGPSLVVLDTSADLYGGDEINRTQVRHFVGMLRHLAIKYRCAVVLLSHPSVAGMLSGSGLSGSTAWNNSVRSRIYLERIKSEGGGEDDTNARRMSNKKANYGPMGIEYTLRWQNGVFVSGGAAAEVRADLEDKAKRVFLKLLAEHNANGLYVNPSSSNSYAPKVFAEHPDAEGVSKAGFKLAMTRLLNGDRQIVVDKLNPGTSRERRYLRLSTPDEMFEELCKVPAKSENGPEKSMQSPPIEGV